MKTLLLVLATLTSATAFAECPNLSGLYTTGSSSLLIQQDGCDEITIANDGYATKGYFDGRKHKGHRFEWLDDGTLSIQDLYFFGNLADTQTYKQSDDGSILLTVSDSKDNVIYQRSYRKVSSP